MAGAGSRTPITWLFLALCCLVTAAMAWPDCPVPLGGLKPLASPWQRATLAFAHGFPGFPAPVHLALNGVLLLGVGRPAERLLGPARFGLLSLAALLAYAAAHLWPAVDGHGASGVIWAYGPVAWVAVRAGHEGGEQLRGLLMVMWVGVTVAMAALVYAGGYRGNPLFALVLGNIFHLSGTAVGIAGALFWRDRIRAAARPAAG